MKGKETRHSEYQLNYNMDIGVHDKVISSVTNT